MRRGDRVAHLYLVCFLSLWILSTSHFIPYLSLTAINLTYDQARDKRTKYGHDIAVPLYQSLLRDNPDITAATRIASASNSPWRHDQACPIPNQLSSESSAVLCKNEEHFMDNKSSKESEDMKVRGAISDLKQILERSNFNNENVQRLFGISPSENDEKHDSSKDRANALSFAQGPVYIKPVKAGDQISLPFIFDELNTNDLPANEQDSSLKCLVALFLLGFAVPKVILSKNLIGGDDSIALLEHLGLAFPCELDPLMIVPYVHLFPMDVKVVGEAQNPESNFAKTIYQRDNLTKKKPRKKAVVFVTDCHPKVLSRTTVGEMEDGAVMYIGPDSLALIQHLPLSLHMAHIFKKDDTLKTATKSSHPFKVLDLCSGSGVQALSTLVSLEDIEVDATAVCVDVNDRALRFIRFNALLNGIDDNRIQTIKADLITGKLLKQRQRANTIIGIRNEPNRTDISGSKEIDLLNTLLCLESTDKFDIILANPPFIPVPPPQYIDEQNVSNVRSTKHMGSSIARRYGLFSSGGANGEDVLESIIRMSSRLIQIDCGLLAIVSEFMNPPSVEEETDHLCENDDNNLLGKMENWWNLGINSFSESRNSTIAVGNGILFTNQNPLPATTYASRRADDKTEFGLWSHHLESKKIHSISPGLLFVETHRNLKKQERGMIKGVLGERHLKLSHQIVPKTEGGSVWTPSNSKAVTFTSNAWIDAINNLN